MKKLPFIAFLTLIVLPLLLSRCDYNIFQIITKTFSNNELKINQYGKIRYQTIGYEDPKYADEIEEISRSSLSTKNKTRLIIDRGGVPLSTETFMQEGQVKEIKGDMLKVDVEGKEVWIKKKDFSY